MLGAALAMQEHPMQNVARKVSGATIHEQIVHRLDVFGEQSHRAPTGWLPSCSGGARRNIGTIAAGRRGRHQAAPARIFRADAYVRDVTATPAECRSRRCQGLHIATFLPYGFRLRSDWLPPGSVASKGFGLVAALPGG
jgi:hypothetical protein